MQFDSFPDPAQIFPGLGPHGEHDFSDLAIEISRMVGATITSTDFPAASVYVACQWNWHHTFTEMAPKFDIKALD